jgi:transcriptional regulator with XRE-family HTH domain
MGQTLGELIGARIRQARRVRGWTQEQLGAELGKVTRGKAWAKQQVYQAERGRRAFDIADLITLALALDYPLWWFVQPDQGADVQVSPGFKLSAKRLTRAVVGPSGLAPDRLNIFAGSVVYVADVIGANVGNLERAAATLRKLALEETRPKGEPRAPRSKARRKK